MEYKSKKNFGRKVATLILLLSFVTSSLYLPISARRAEAFLGFGDVTVTAGDIPRYVERVIQIIAMTMAKQMVDHVVRSTVNWAQSGFEGNPSYAVNPRKYFGDIADGVAGEYIQGTALGGLCSPFRAQVRLSLAQVYTQPTQFQCTLSGIVDNIEDFYSDFSKGGWDAWFVMTQNPNNNPYGAFLNARLEMDSRIASAVGLANRELDWGRGFLSRKTCPPGSFEGLGNQLQNTCLDNDTWEEVETITTTPGTIIESQLNSVLPLQLQGLVNAQHIEQLISAFASGLLNRYVFNSDRGLFARNSTVQSSSEEIIDVDGDKIPDGWDYNGDGQLDICHHGLRSGLSTGSRPSNENCLGSTEVRSSPFFAPLCSSLGRAISEGESFSNFLNTNTFLGRNDAILWSNKLTSWGGALDNLQSTMFRMDVQDWYPALRSISGGLTHVNDHVNKLAKDQRLAYGFGSDSSADGMREWTPQLVQYFKDFRTAIDRCDDPNTAAAGALTPPPPPSGGGGPQCTYPTVVWKYEDALWTAMRAVLAENPDLADSLNTLENGRRFLAITVEKLQAAGYQATDRVLNGNNLFHHNDLIAVWRSGDAQMERYDVIIDGGGGNISMSRAVAAQFVGLIPLNCTDSGGGTDCADKCIGGTWVGGPEGPEPTNPSPGSPFISSVSPTTVAVGGAVTLTGSSLTSTVQFFDASGGRYTVTGSVNSASTSVTATVPAGFPAGSATVRVYKDASTVSNTVSIQVTNTGGGGGEATVTSVNATGGWGGGLVHNPTNNTWLVVSSGSNGTVGRVMGNDMQPVSAQFTLDPGHSGGPSVAYASDINKYLVAWIGWGNGEIASAIYGRFVNPDGTLSGDKFIIHRDNPYPHQTSGFTTKAVQYDSKNQKFVIVWGVKIGSRQDVVMATVSSTGTVGTLVNVTGNFATNQSTSDDGRGTPSLAINETGNEYCIAYQRGHSTSGGQWYSWINTVRINSSTNTIGSETTVASSFLLSNPLHIGNVAYNSTGGRYLVSYVEGGITKGKFFTGCNGSNAGSALTLNPYSSANSLAYNPRSNTFATIGQNGPNAGNTLIILDANGNNIKQEVAFGGGWGNFAPSVAANLTDGSFAATSAYEYAVTRFVSNLKK